MAATLAVHPSLTTRTEDREKQSAANSALRYLRLVNRVVGPLNADLSAAFTFTEPGSRTARRRRGRGAGRSESPDEGNDGGGASIKSRYAERDSVFARGGDFWQVVGWAFNCSVLHPRRWERWSLWLEMVLEVLEADLEARIANVEEATNRGVISRAEDTIIQSLVVRYIGGAGQGRTAWRRMMRAVLADGSKKAVSEFGEVWEGEAREPRKMEEKKARAREVDIEGDKWGDYDLSDEEDEVMNGNESHLRVRSSRNSTRHTSDHSEQSDSEGLNEEDAVKESSSEHLLGGLDSILLRQRIMALVRLHTPNITEHPATHLLSALQNLRTPPKRPNPPRRALRRLHRIPTPPPPPHLQHHPHNLPPLPRNPRIPLRQPPAPPHHHRAPKLQHPSPLPARPRALLPARARERKQLRRQRESVAAAANDCDADVRGREDCPDGGVWSGG